MKNDTTDTGVSSVRGRSVFGGPRGEATFSLSLIAVSVGTIAYGIMDDATAQMSCGAAITYTDDRVVSLGEVVMTCIEGSFGARLMAFTGLAAILTTALAKYKSSKRLLVLAFGFFAIAVGLFVGRAVMENYFNDVGICTEPECNPLAP
jgi:hypothetical protein